MGLFDSLRTLSSELSQTQKGAVASSLMQTLQQHPGGIAGVIQTLRQNGMAQHVDQWSSGQQTQPTPDQVEQGLNGTNIVENTAQRAGVSHQVASAAIAALLPALIQHFAPGGQTAPPEQMGGLAQQFLNRIL